jgi:hypothetical protein
MMCDVGRNWAAVAGIAVAGEGFAVEEGVVLDRKRHLATEMAVAVEVGSIERGLSELQVGTMEEEHIAVELVGAHIAAGL